MDEELQLRYLYFLSCMYSGTDKWKDAYDAWQRLGNNMKSENYSKLMSNIVEFHKKYAIKKKKS